MTTTPEAELDLGTASDVEEPDSPRYAAHRIVAARTGDLHARMLLTRAQAVGKTHRRSESHEGAALTE